MTGIDGLRLHDLRHTGNTLAAATGASTKELMSRMGHASRAALIYQHATQDRDAAIAAGLSDLIVQAREHRDHSYKAHRGRSAGVGRCRVMPLRRAFAPEAFGACRFVPASDRSWTIRGHSTRHVRFVVVGRGSVSCWRRVGCGGARQRLAARTAVMPTSRVMTARVTMRLLLEPVTGSWGPKSVAGV